MIATDFPQVEVKMGTGSLFWGGGMRDVWELAIKTAQFDYYLWLIDDTVLIENSIVRLFQEYERIGQPSILTASCKKP
jgi:GT2 family glycosyltransferase